MENLCKLMIGLSDATIQVPVTIETNTNVNEKNGVISPMGIYPAVVYTDDNYSWFCCFTREQEIIKEFKEKYTVLEFKFEDLRKMFLIMMTLMELQ